MLVATRNYHPSEEEISEAMLGGAPSRKAAVATAKAEHDAKTLHDWLGDSIIATGCIPPVPWRKSGGCIID